MTASNNTVIQLDHVNYFDGDVHILKDITGSFPEGK